MLVKDARNTKYKELRILPHSDWRPEELAVAVFGDSSYQNRAKGASTGGLFAVVALPPTFLDGELTEATPVLFRSRKLERKPIGSSDSEVQAIHHGENQLYKLRVLLGELNGVGLSHGRDWVQRAAACHDSV